MENEVFKNYLYDLGILLKEYSIDAKKQKDASMGGPEEDFSTGYLCGFHRVISLMQQQAEGFNLSLAEIGLEDIEPDKDLS